MIRLISMILALFFPNAAMTPGAAITTRAKDVCSPGWASAHRHVTQAQRLRVWKAYGYDAPKAGWELDHLVPLELGGGNGDANLWPEPPDPRVGWRAKDKVENAAHAAVCSGRVTVRAAQSGISHDWAAFGRKLGVPIPTARNWTQTPFARNWT